MALPPWNTCLSRTILWTGWFSTRATVLNWERRINSSVPESRAGSSTDGRAGPGAEGGKGVVSLALWFPATWPSGLPLLFLLRTELTYFPSRSSPLTLLCLHCGVLHTFVLIPHCNLSFIFQVSALRSLFSPAHIEFTSSSSVIQANLM